MFLYLEIRLLKLGKRVMKVPSMKVSKSLLRSKLFLDIERVPAN